MRIALVTNHLAGGGAERQAVLWAEACAALGHEPVIVVLRQRLSRDYDVRAGIEVRYLQKSSALGLPRVVLGLRKLARDSDLLVAFQSYPAICCALAGRRAPFMMVAGVDPRYLRDTSRFPASLLRWAIGRASTAAAPTRGIASAYERLRMVPRGGWRMIPNIVDDAAFTETAVDKRDVLFVGRLMPVKNPELAIEAAAAAGARLTMLGSGKLKEELERSLRERPNGARVELRGFMARPWEIYASHRVLLVTSRYESFGNMIVESLAAGTPVVSVDCDYGPRELIGDARYSHLSEPSPDRLGKLLGEVLERPYSEDERRECLEIASRYRPAAIHPEIEQAITEAVR